MSELSGMTVNERSYAKKLFAEWDAAVLRKDRNAMINLLGQVELPDQAALIADSVLNRDQSLTLRHDPRAL
jgi:hypothetical protein